MKRTSLAVFLILALIVGVVYSETPSEEPILRIEIGMHTAEISKIDIDTENRYLITASYDKTVRVWELPSGRLITTLRTPIGWGDEGKIYSIAISPDAKTIACGGWTGYEWEEFNSIYFFNIKNGRLIKRIKGLPSVILHLAYSQDGRFLVATIGRGGGIHIYSTSDYSKVAEDRDYRLDSYGADFDINGRLITSSYDGFIRLYDSNFKLIAKNKAPHGDRPYFARFSPDGSKIAVGFDDSTSVDVLSGKDLSYLYSPDIKGIDNGDLSKVSWSLDGRFLYAGGRYARENINYIRKWEDEGLGEYKDLSATHDTIMQIRPLKEGIVFGSADPGLGIFDKDDKRILYMGSPNPDFRANDEGFLISDDGRTVQFSYEYGGKSPARFSVLNSTILLEPPKDPSLKPPIISSDDLDISDWKHGSPQLDGKPLPLKQYEISRSLAISPNRETFLIGTDWYLRLFDREGNELWNIPTPAPAWSVNISGNSKVVVAALGDGTIRWYTMDGEEILSLFLHKEKKLWVIWTPSGYYHASPDAYKIIGFHQNKGLNKAGRFSYSKKFKDIYQRADVVRKVLETFDETEALRLADAELAEKKTDSRVRVKRKGKTTYYYYDLSPKDSK